MVNTRKVKRILTYLLCVISIFVLTITSVSAAEDANRIPGCDENKLKDVAKYYGYSEGEVDDLTFTQGKTVISCDKSKEGRSGYKKVELQYNDSSIPDAGVEGENNINQMIVVTNIDLGIEDVYLDIRDGIFHPSGLLLSDSDAWNMVFASMQGIIVGISGLSVLLCLLAFTLSFIKLGTVADNPTERARVVKGIIWSGIGAAGCGSAALVFGIAFGII